MAATTTVKVSGDTRARLAEYSRARGLTLGQGISDLLDQADDALAMAQLEREVRATPPEVMAEYRTELEQWLDSDLG